MIERRICTLLYPLYILHIIGYANTKKIFAPPKALDEDDVNYFKELEETKSKALEARSIRDEKNVSSFKEAIKKIENQKPTIIKIGNTSSSNTNKETE